MSNLKKLFIVRRYVMIEIFACSSILYVLLRYSYDKPGSTIGFKNYKTIIEWLWDGKKLTVNGGKVC